jgi:glycosidase
VKSSLYIIPTGQNLCGGIRATIFLLCLFPAVVSAGDPPPTDVPEWAKTAVWYQIFPERFRNGDTANDPTASDLAGSWPHDDPGPWQVSSWTGDWYALQEWEKGERGFYYRTQQRRYGGDLQGVIDQLDYLHDLGITAIYFNPVFEAPSLHKYDAALYHHIDNNFGPDPEGDRKIWATEDPSDPATWQWSSADQLFLALINRAHDLGIRIIIDGVFNHVGLTFWAFRDVVDKGSSSPYKEWFTIKSWDDPATEKNEFDYAGWNGVRELPEIREDSSGLVAGPREHVRHIIRRWMDPNGDGDPSDGIDGWRLDVAEKVEIEFWREFRTWVRTINPEAFIVGEVWWEDWKNGKMFNAAPWLKGDAFDAVMNYRWAREVGHFFKDRKNKTTATVFDERLRHLLADYREDVNMVLMNLMSSHDCDRLGSQIVNVDADYDRHVGLQDNPDYNVRKPNATELQIQKLIVLYQMTATGAPCVYYGEEAGMWGADDPDDRKPMLWPDMVYDNEASHPFGKPRPNDINVFNRELFDHYRTLIHLRREHPVLALGTNRTVITDDGRDVYAFLRSDKENRILVVLNNHTGGQEVVLPGSDPVASEKWEALFASPGTSVGKGGTSFTLPAKSGIILMGKGN